MKQVISRTSMVALIAILAMFSACRSNYPGEPTPAAIQETIQEIDTYRATEGQRTLDSTFSDDPSLLTVTDTLTTAGAQFTGPIARITLADVLLTTLRNNHSIEVADYERTIAELGIEAARGIYDLLIEASYNFARQYSQSTVYNGTGMQWNDLQTNKRQDQTLGVILSQLISTGGVFQLYSEYSHVKTYGPGATLTSAGVRIPIADPYESFAVGVSFIQPLLKGFGPYVTNAPIQIARIQQKIALEGFRQEVIDQLARAVQTYWDLVFAINNYEVQQLSLKRAQELLRVTRIKEETGVEPPNVVLQAEADVSRREALVIDAQRQIADTADRLKKAMNVPESAEEWNFNLIPVDKPDFEPVNLNEEAIYQEALALRPDYRA
ncbi:TolC family protein, partial [bacterium]|nr:TolC family protein [bacterium]